MHGGRRPGAGRKPGSRNRPKSEIRRERALREISRVASAERRSAKAAAAAEAAEREAARAKAREAQADALRARMLPELATIAIPPGASPLDFLLALMRDPLLPLSFRRDAAALALPYVHAKPLMGLKDWRRQAAFDDDGEDEIAAAMRGESAARH